MLLSICVLNHVVVLQIWFQVKAANPQLSVCQIGATIGRMWRELSEAEKQRHLEEFQQDKVSCWGLITRKSYDYLTM